MLCFYHILYITVLYIYIYTYYVCIYIYMYVYIYNNVCVYIKPNDAQWFLWQLLGILDLGVLFCRSPSGLTSRLPGFPNGLWLSSELAAKKNWPIPYVYFALFTPVRRSVRQGIWSGLMMDHHLHILYKRERALNAVPISCMVHG